MTLPTLADTTYEQDLMNSESIPNLKSYFAADEHTSIGDSLSLSFPDQETVLGKDFEFDIKGVKVSLGNIVALAGDFYGNWKTWGDAEQISDKWPTDQRASINRFLTNAKDLAEDTPGYLKKVLAIMIEEKAIIRQAIEDGKDPAQKHASIADDFNFKYALATSTSKQSLNSAYLMISLCNWDHFGQDAINTYKAGHTAAQEHAKKAGKKQDTDGLRFAYFLEGFALHFLTDLFSSGHLRVPRRVLHNTLTGNQKPPPGDLVWPGDTCAQEFHDEDCANGLFVTNELGHWWPMYGDGQLFNTKSMKNLSQAVEASQVGINEVWAAFKSSQREPTFDALKWVPKLDMLNYPADYSGLFRYDGKETLGLRTEIERRDATAYTTVARSYRGFANAMGEIKKSGTRINRLPLTKTFQSTAYAIHLQKINGTFFANQYGPLTCKDYGQVPPVDATSWNVIARKEIHLGDSAKWTWTASEFLSEDVVLSTQREVGREEQGRFVAYRLSYGIDENQPIQELWSISAEEAWKKSSSDCLVVGKFTRGSAAVGFLRYGTAAGDEAAFYECRDGLTQPPTKRNLASVSNITFATAVRDISGAAPDLLAVVASLGTPGDVINVAVWIFCQWEAAQADPVVTSASQPAAPEWDSESILKLEQAGATQLVRVSLETGYLGIEVFEVGNSIFDRKFNQRYPTTAWGNPNNKQYLKWLLLDVTGSGRLDLVSLVNTSESTMIVLVFPNNSYFDTPPVVSIISIPDSLFNPSFFRPVKITSTSYTYPVDKTSVNCAILQLFSNYNVLGARLLAPVRPKSLQYELKGQTPAIAGQISAASGAQEISNWQGFFVKN